MTREEIMQILEKTGVILNGHFRLTSGRHSDMFLQCSQVMQYPRFAEKICAALAEQWKDAGVELVVGPAMGGVVMAYEVARHLGVRAIFAEKDNGKMVLKRGFAIRPGENVLLVEDAVSTGGSVNEVAETVAQCGGNIVGIGALVDRTGGKISFGVPFKPLLSVEVNSWAPTECPMCKEGKEVTLPKAATIL